VRILGRPRGRCVVTRRSTDALQPAVDHARRREEKAKAFC
jgi:hypothetical protein